MPWIRRIRLKLLRSLDLIVDGSCRRIGVIAPNIAQQLFAAEHALRILVKNRSSLNSWAVRDMTLPLFLAIILRKSISQSPNP